MAGAHRKLPEGFRPPGGKVTGVLIVPFRGTLKSGLVFLREFSIQITVDRRECAVLGLVPLRGD